MPDRAHKIRVGGAILAALYVAPYIFRPRRFGLLDHVDLAIHEAGHLVFAPLGDIMGVAGGSLFQLIVPAAFVAYFWHAENRYAAFMVLFWLAQSMFNVATYIADARAQLLPLVGGEGVIHDWWFLLTMADLSDHDTTIAAIVRTVALLVTAGALIGALRTAVKGEEAAPGDRPT